MAATFVVATRLQFVLPCGSSRLYQAANATISYLLADKRVQRWGGFTRSDIAHPIFIGVYWSPAKSAWEQDRNALVWLDIQTDSDGDLMSFIEEAHLEVYRIYQRERVPQELMWLTMQPLSIVYADSTDIATINAGGSSAARLAPD